MSRRRETDRPTLATIPRAEFVARRFKYETGEHVTVVGPTGCGKSHLVFELLEQVATPARPVVYLVKKPRDRLIKSAGKRMKLRNVKTWPPSPSIFAPRKPRGWLLWPRTRFDQAIDRPHKATVFRKALLASYKNGNRTVVADDAYGIAKLLQLESDLIEFWTEARSMDAGLWSMFQKPTHVPLWAYSQAEHLFLFNDPDERARDRFAEIGGVDPDLVRDTVMALKKHQCLYIRRGGPRMCIVDM